MSRSIKQTKQSAVIIEPQTTTAIQRRLYRNVLGLEAGRDIVGVPTGHRLLVKPPRKRAGRPAVWSRTTDAEVLAELRPHYQRIKRELVLIAGFYRGRLKSNRDIRLALAATRKAVPDIAPSLPARYGWKRIAGQLQTQRRVKPAALAADLAAEARLRGRFPPMAINRYARLLRERRHQAAPK